MLGSDIEKTWSDLALALVRCFKRLERSIPTAVVDDDDEDDSIPPLALPPLALALLPVVDDEKSGWRGRGVWPLTIT